LKGKRNSNTVAIVVLVLIVLSLFGSMGSCETQYDKDFKSAQNKTWDELTPGEKRATEDYINWTVEQSEKEGADWSVSH